MFIQSIKQKIESSVKIEMESWERKCTQKNLKKKDNVINGVRGFDGN